MRRDFEKFFTKLQLDYNVMLKNKSKIDEEYQKGLLTEDQYSNFMSYFGSVKVNYDRVNFMRYLLHKPPKFIDDIIQWMTTKDVYNELNKYKELKADDESVLSENADAIEKADEVFEDAGIHR